MPSMDSTMESMSIQVYLILLSILSYYTMDKMDSTMESKYLENLYEYSMSSSYCPSRPWTRWIALWNPSIHSSLHYPTVHPVLMDWMDSTMNLIVYLHIHHYPTVHPVLLYHGQDGQYSNYGIQVSI